jgi:hypothetical protein
LPRFTLGRDRLYRKFALHDPATGVPLTAAQYVTDLSRLPVRRTELRPPRPGKKGLTCVVDIQDALDLGISYADEGLIQSSLIDWRNPEPGQTWTVDGHRVPINAGYVRALDEKYRRLSEGGCRMIPIPINILPLSPEAGNPLIHPDTDVAGAPTHLGAFNVRTAEGVRAYLAMIEFLAERYTREDGEFGLIAGLVIGNEIQAHWHWHNQGEVDKREVIRDYVIAVRLAWLASARYHADLPIYISMTHSWTHLYGGNPQRAIRGDDLLEGIRDEACREGDFPWHVAFHPYPENLFEPRFWEDTTAVRRFDSLRITFRNLEVLPVFLGQERFLHKGRMRRITLSEQGFHTPAGPDGEAVQAAAFAGAFHKVRHMPEIEALILHRHVSMRDEGGLDLGLWTFDPEDPAGARPGRRKRIWEVFRDAGTERWEESFAFARPILGIESWDSFLPDYTIDTTPRPHAESENLVLDLMRLDLADVQNSTSFHSDPVVSAGGWPVDAIFHHPPVSGEGRAAYTVELPACRDGERLLFRTETAITGDSTNGVRFALDIGSTRVWQAEQTTRSPVERTVELTDFAAQRVTLSLVVDSLSDPTNDWAHWLAPRVLRTGD